MNIFGVHVKNLTRNQIWDRVCSAMDSKEEAVQIVTLNPEMLVEARSNPKFASIVHEAGIVAVDGFGISLIGRYLYNEQLARVTGTEILEDLVKACADHSLPILLLGGEGDDAKLAALAIKSQYPNLSIKGMNGGMIHLLADGNWEMEPSTLDEIIAFQPAVIAVALGHGKQEAWIASHLNKFLSVRFMIGVGGVFAFLSGRIERAPLAWRQMGLEWLWRLIQEPSRLIRILTAAVVFPTLAIWDRLRRIST